MRVSLPIFTRSAGQQQSSVKTSLTNNAASSQKALASDTVSLSHKAPHFGALIKMNGTNGAKKKDGSTFTDAEAQALESSSDNRNIKYVVTSPYEQPGQAVTHKYYQDPEKPDNIWLATQDELSNLLYARHQSESKFKDTFKSLKDKGTHNFQLKH